MNLYNNIIVRNQKKISDKRKKNITLMLMELGRKRKKEYTRQIRESFEVMAVEVQLKLAALIHVILIVTCENVKWKTTVTILHRHHKSNYFLFFSFSSLGIKRQERKGNEKKDRYLIENE